MNSEMAYSKATFDFTFDVVFLLETTEKIFKTLSTNIIAREDKTSRINRM